MFQPLLRYLTNLDARAIRAVIVSALLFVAVALVFVMGRTTAIFDEDDAPIFQWLQSHAQSPWSLPATIVLFTLASFLGAPQFGLIAVAVIAFGPTQGAVYAWISTMVSSAVHFQLARLTGAGVLRRYGGESVNRISKLIGRNGFWSSLVVRIVPSAPPIVVNMAAGVSHMPFAAYLAGTALGIIPKIALVAFFGGSIKSLAQDGDLTLALMLAGVALGWLLAVVWARRALRDRVSDASDVSGERAGEAASEAAGAAGRKRESAP
jgi:uncharacterized membrane protein YdjX (TVP38/TMEM64 family)